MDRPVASSSVPHCNCVRVPTCRSLEIFSRPVACVPCGHCYCLSCLETTEVDGDYRCEECCEAVSSFVHNVPLEGLCAKYEYKLMAVKSLQKMLKAPSRPESKKWSVS